MSPKKTIIIKYKPADDVLVICDKPIYLMEGDVLEGGCSPATADIFISYEVIDDA